MSGHLWAKSCLVMLTLAGLAIGEHRRLALGQPVGDGTLNTQVSSNGSVFEIIGGQQAGPNLFHSFQAFNIPPGSTAEFLPSATVEAIFSRITDTAPSKIGGRIAVVGNADLFLLNPNGFVFEAGSSLSLNGDFTLATAESVDFANGDRFFSSPSRPSLLTVSTPMGLGNLAANSTIENLSNLTNNGGDISMSAGLIAGTGDLRSSNSIQLTSQGSLKQGNLIAPMVFTNAQGDAFLTAISAPLSVLLVAGGDLHIAQGITTLGAGGEAGSVELKAGGAISVDGKIDSRSTAPVGDAGSVKLQAGGDIRLTEIQAHVGPATQGDSGDVKLWSGGTLAVTNGAIATFNAANGVGHSGDISLEARDILLTGTRLQASNLGEGRGGDIQLHAQNSIQLNSSPSNNVSRILSSSESQSQGDSGNILLQAGEIKLVDTVLDAQMKGVGLGGNITLLATNSLPPGQTHRISLSGDRSSSELVTRLTGQGQAGNIRLVAKDVALENATRLRSATEGRGDAGAISIQSLDLRLGDHSSIETGNLRRTARGNGGQLLIETEQLSLNTGRLLSESQGQGDAGDIEIKASGAVTIAGEPNSGLASLLRASVMTSGQGQAGRIAIQAGDLTLSNQSQVQANAENAGASPGQIEITADNVLLSNGVRLSTDVKNSASGPGGPISITAQRIEAIGNSDITAKSRGADLGAILLKAQVIDGLQARDLLTPDSDLLGTVAIEILPDSIDIPVDLPEGPSGEIGPGNPSLPNEPNGTSQPSESSGPNETMAPGPPLPEPVRPFSEPSSEPARPFSEPARPLSGPAHPLPDKPSLKPGTESLPQGPRPNQMPPMGMMPRPFALRLGPGDLVAPVIAIARSSSLNAQDESNQNLQLQLESLRRTGGLQTPQFLGCRDSDATLRLSGRGGLADSALQVLAGRLLWLDSRVVSEGELATGHGAITDGQARWAQQTMSMFQEAIAFQRHGNGDVDLVAQVKDDDLFGDPSNLLSQTEICRQVQPAPRQVATPLP